VQTTQAVEQEAEINELEGSNDEGSHNRGLAQQHEEEGEDENKN